MPTPSLLIVPARFKTGKLYSQIPTSGAGDFTVTRATSATRVDASGFIESVASGIPRLDYFASGGTVGCPALLVEPSAQNLAFNSQTWTSANNWRADVSGNITTVTGAITAPDGTMTANAISPTAVSGSHGFASLGVTFASGTNYTASAFFKQGIGVGRFVQLTYTTAMNSGAGFANFDLQLGTVTASGGTNNVAARIENYGNGWYRCAYTATCNANAANALGFLGTLISTSGATRSPSFLGVTGDVLYGWGAQLETGSVATSYIPTTTGSVTRNADVVTVSGAVSGSIGQTEGTIYFQTNKLMDATLERFFSIYSSTSPTNDNISISKTTSNTIIFGIRKNNVLSTYAPSFSGTVLKFACAFNTASGGVAIYVNGTQLLIDTNSGSFASVLNEVYIGRLRPSVNTDNLYNGRIRAVALYNARLTNAELAALTTP